MKYRETRKFKYEALQNACKGYNLCNMMDNREYSALLDRADAIQNVTTDHLVEIADWIVKGTDELDMEYTTLLFIINRATYTQFDEE